MEESLGNPRDSLYFKGFHGTIYSRKNGRIMRNFRVISRKGVVTDEMSLLPTHRHEGDRL